MCVCVYVCMYVCMYLDTKFTIKVYLCKKWGAHGLAATAAVIAWRAASRDAPSSSPDSAT